MPITDINSYDATTAEFNANWLEANAELGVAAPILLAGNYDRVAFVGERTALLSLIKATRIAQENERNAFFDLSQRKSAMLTRGRQFRGAVLSKITAPTILKDLKPIPNDSAEPALFIEPFRAAARLWTRIDDDFASYGLSGPLTLAGGYPLAQFEVDITGFANSSEFTSRISETASTSKGTRNNAMAAIYERLKQYRAAAPAFLPPNSPALTSLPRLTPPPGTTPPPLGAVGVWNVATLMADLTWTATTDKTVNKIQIRGCIGSTYHGDEEAVVMDLAPTATSWSGDWGLEAPGSMASFKAVAMTSTGNENGGKAVKIVRPYV